MRDSVTSFLSARLAMEEAAPEGETVSLSLCGSLSPNFNNWAFACEFCKLRIRQGVLKSWPDLSLSKSVNTHTRGPRAITGTRVDGQLSLSKCPS